MTDSRAALGSDRLPWLTDEPAVSARTPRARQKSASPLTIWVPAAAAALLAVAGGSYWLGTRSAPAPSHSASAVVHQSLPPASTPAAEPQIDMPPQPQIAQAPAPEVRSAPQRDVRIERPRAVERTIVQNPEQPPAEAPADSGAATSAAPVTPKAAAPAVEQPLRAWPATESQGARGRIVRIGAFGTRQQAKLGWRFMVQAYPAVSHLKATVVTDRNSRGRRFYRFQIGTTSQAHSEVLCQRMEKIHLSCAVVGLPWDPKGVER